MLFDVINLMDRRRVENAKIVCFVNGIINNFARFVTLDGRSISIRILFFFFFLPIIQFILQSNQTNRFVSRVEFHTSFAKLGNVVERFPVNFSKRRAQNRFEATIVFPPETTQASVGNQAHIGTLAELSVPETSHEFAFSRLIDSRRAFPPRTSRTARSVA